MSGKISFTINFSEEDEFLLSYLQTFPQEQWEGLIKEALQVHAAKPADSITLPKEENPQNSGLTKWRIEELFVAPPAQESKQAKDPLGHLFAIIGEEDDEDVLELLLNSNTHRSKGLLDYKAPLLENTVENLKEDLKEAQEDKKESPLSKDVTGSKGLAFVLNQVIGEEEDPEVLRFFSVDK